MKIILRNIRNIFSIFKSCTNDNSITYPFVLHWVWGHQTTVSPINISSQKERKIFFAAGPVAICYDWMANTQHFLLGHQNDIISIATTPDKNYLVSVDKGFKNALIIWHAETRCIFHVIDYFSKDGVVSMCFSSDGNELFALSSGETQELTIWNWKSKMLTPDFSFKYEKRAESQHHISVHPVYSSHFVSSGKKSVYFFERKDEVVKMAVMDITSLYNEKVSKRIGNFTQTSFSPLSSLAVTATSKGTVILWGRPLYSREKPAHNSLEWYVMDPQRRVCIRLLQAMESRCAILFLSTIDDYIIAGSAKGEIFYYDESFNVQWLQYFNEGQINNISFSYKPKFEFKGVVKKILGKKVKSSEDVFEEKDFIISTVEGFVGYYSAASKKMKEVFCGTNHKIKSVTIHPVWPYLYFGDFSGRLQKWNYKSKKIINKEIYEGDCSEVQQIAVDNKGVYAACGMSNGNVVIFDAVCFSSKPSFIAVEVLHKPLMINFSPDSQHLLITDASSYVSHYHLQLLVIRMAIQMTEKNEVPSEEPFWSFGGKTRQHQGRIVDCIFNDYKENKNTLYYTLGEDRILVEYNISNSKGHNINISKRIPLEKQPIPTCMTWYPLYSVSNLLAVLNDDGKMRVYCTKMEKVVKIVSLPVFDEPVQRIIFQKKIEKFSGSSNLNEVFQYFIFNCPHMIGLAKYPIDGNPNTFLGLNSTPSGVNTIVSNRDQTYLFTTGLQDSWIFMYEINIKALNEEERKGGEGIDAFKYLFPTNCDPDDMKKRLIYSVYSLELEMKMLKLGEGEQPILTGEIPINFLEYVLAALGFFVSSSDMQMILKDIEFESNHKYDGKKTTLTCLDIMKLYVNYRPTESLTISKLRNSFKNILSLEEDPDQIPRARFINILSTRGDMLSKQELAKILHCLQNKSVEEMNNDSSEDHISDQKDDENEVSHITATDESDVLLKQLIPEFISEEIFFQEILSLETAEEDFTKYILKKEDFNLVQEYPTLEEFVSALKKDINETDVL